MLASKLRKMATTLTGQIADKRRPRQDNTPKRQREAASARIEADHLNRVRVALEKLATAHETGTVPTGLAGIKNKADLLPMLATRIDTSGGYYSVVDTGEFRDQSPTAVALRAWLDGIESEDEKAAKVAAAKQNRIAELEARVRFLDIPGFFPTPPELCALIRERANLNKPFLKVLEPSAGKGDLAEAMWTDSACRPTHAAVHVCEISRTLLEILVAKGCEVVGEDFLQLNPLEVPRYNRVVMNPPFERSQDADHVRHAFKFLGPGGRLVAVMSTGPFFRSDRKATEFREWFEKVGGEKEDLPEGSFAGAFRSTGVNTCLVVIDREE